MARYCTQKTISCMPRGGTLAAFPGQWVFAASAGTMVAARTKEANHLKVVIARAPQPGWLKEVSGAWLYLVLMGQSSNSPR
jgi:hypothetical protein